MKIQWLLNALPLLLSFYVIISWFKLTSLRGYYEANKWSLSFEFIDFHPIKYSFSNMDTSVQVLFYKYKED